MTKIQIIKATTENNIFYLLHQHQTHQILKNHKLTSRNGTKYSTIDLTDYNKSKPSGSQTRNDNLSAIGNNNNYKILKDNKITPYKYPWKNLKSINALRKNTLIVGDSILKHVEGWCLNKSMKSTVSVRSIPGTSTYDMTHHIKGCLED